MSESLKRILLRMDCILTEDFTSECTENMKLNCGKNNDDYCRIGLNDDLEIFSATGSNQQIIDYINDSDRFTDLDKANFIKKNKNNIILIISYEPTDTDLDDY